jgi:hypothetical protein
MDYSKNKRNPQFNLAVANIASGMVSLNLKINISIWVITDSGFVSGYRQKSGILVLASTKIPHVLLP